MLRPAVLREARTAADALYKTTTTTWGHMLGAAGGGAVSYANLVASTHEANAMWATIEMHLRTFLANIDRWGVRQNYNAQFVVNVTYWSDNLAEQVIGAAENANAQRQPPAGEILEGIRGTLNFLRDPYNFGVFPELPPPRR
jgi:hypothetical protein